jgi:hypothetical protein
MSVYHDVLGVLAPTKDNIVVKGVINKYCLIGTGGDVYGTFPTEVCASLALKGMKTMIDDIVIRKQY